MVTATVVTATVTQYKQQTGITGLGVKKKHLKRLLGDYFLNDYIDKKKKYNHVERTEKCKKNWQINFKKLKFHHKTNSRLNITQNLINWRKEVKT